MTERLKTKRVPYTLKSGSTASGIDDQRAENSVAQLFVSVGPSFTSDSNHAFGGSYYSRNKTGPRSVGVYGNTGNSDIPVISGLKSSGSHCSTPFANPDIGESSKEESTSRSSADSESESPRSVSPPLPLPPTQIIRNRLKKSPEGTNRDRDPFHWWQPSEDARTIFEHVAATAFSRRDTASWFQRGKVFKIKAEHCDDLADRCMIVVGTPASSIVCLPLCRYSDITGTEEEFLRARVPVHSGNVWNPHRPYAKCAWRPLAIVPADGRKMLDGVWINCEKPYTIHQRALLVALCGQMDERDLHVLHRAYIQAQSELTKPDGNTGYNCLAHIGQWLLYGCLVTFLLMHSM